VADTLAGIARRCRSTVSDEPAARPSLTLAADFRQRVTRSSPFSECATLVTFFAGSSIRDIRAWRQGFPPCRAITAGPMTRSDRPVRFATADGTVVSDSGVGHRDHRRDDLTRAAGAILPSLGAVRYNSWVPHLVERGSPRCPRRPEAQDAALSRLKHGFESRRGRHASQCFRVNYIGN
jgi:hypothetical protein